MSVTCFDCACCASRDVFHGFCEKEQKDVLLDQSLDCESFVVKTKCKNCANYQETGDFIGSCRGSIPTYPDLLSCKDYVKAGN